MSEANYGFVKDERQYADMLRELRMVSRDRGMIAVDLETSGLTMYAGDVVRGISCAWDLGGYGIECVYFPISHPDSYNVDPAPLIEILNAHRGVQVFHNANGVDWPGLAQLGYVRPDPRYFLDTQILCWLIDENQSQKLKEIAARLWGIDEKDEVNHLKSIRDGRPLADCMAQAKAELKERDPKATFKAHAEWLKQRRDELHAATVRDWDTFTAEDIGVYAAKDAQLTYRLAIWCAEQMRGEMKYGNPRPDVRREHDFQYVLYEMMRAGVRVNVEQCQTQLDAILEERQKHIDYINEEAGYEINLNSPDQKAALLFDQLGLEVFARSKKTGKPSTSKDAIVAHDWHPVVQAILEYQSLQKEVIGFYRPMLHHADANGRVHSSFCSSRTVTGRLSSSLPNLQNVKKKDEVRQCFRADDGKEMWEYDLAGAELRVIASMAKEQEMIDLLVAGEDLHGLTASSVFGPEYTDFERGLGKNMNFTLPYFGGWEPIARYMAKGAGTQVTAKIEYEAKRAHDNWHRKWTRIHHLMHYLEEIAKRDGYVPLHKPGRFRRFRSPGRMAGYHTALNAIVQGGIGELMKDIMLAQDGVVSGRLVLQVHDSLAYEVLPGYGPVVQEQLQGILDEINPFKIPMRFDAKQWVLAT